MKVYGDKKGPIIIHITKVATHDLIMFQTCVGYVSDMIWTCFGDHLDMSWVSSLINDAQAREPPPWGLGSRCPLEKCHIQTLQLFPRKQENNDLLATYKAFVPAQLRPPWGCLECRVLDKTRLFCRMLDTTPTNPTVVPYYLQTLQLFR